MIITGLISAVCFVALVIKYPLRKLGYNKANEKMMRVHEVASAGVFGMGFAHGCLALVRTKGKVKSKRQKRKIASGITFFTLITVLIAACHMTEDREKKMKDHRALSLASTLALLVHITSKDE